MIMLQNFLLGRLPLAFSPEFGRPPYTTLCAVDAVWHGQTVDFFKILRYK